MVDNSNADDDSFIQRDGNSSHPPFDIGAMVMLNPAYRRPGEDAMLGKGKVVDLRPDYSGWRAHVQWAGGDPTWVPTNRLLGD